MIRIAKSEEISSILELTRACAEYMIANGIYQWNDTYPSREAFESDIVKNELYVFEQENEIIGTIVISDFMDEEYKTINWISNTNKNIYIHRLAVHPLHQGKGIAKKLMDFAENYARKNNYESIRLDTFSKNERNQKIYRKRGYKQLGNVYFPTQSEYPFYCYELIL